MIKIKTLLFKQKSEYVKIWNWNLTQLQFIESLLIYIIYTECNTHKITHIQIRFVSNFTDVWNCLHFKQLIGKDWKLKIKEKRYMQQMKNSFWNTIDANKLLVNIHEFVWNHFYKATNWKQFCSSPSLKKSKIHTTWKT